MSGRRARAGVWVLLGLAAAWGGEEAQGPKPAPLSAESERCITCHEQQTPGIVAAWRRSHHARVSPAAALTRPELERRVSAKTVPEPLRDTVVGCHECHSLNEAAREDRFKHYGATIHVVVSPRDCQRCHPEEAEQFARSKKAHALDNLAKNPLYHTLAETLTGVRHVEGGKLRRRKATDTTRAETCYACHGTRVGVTGTRKVETDLGTISVPALGNWPNQGVGRVNPDGSRGSCTACHPRHAFSIAVARQPATCGQCHLEPDVPAYNVYTESKHGNLYASAGRQWAWERVPWAVGRDFAAPTCATCHNSLVVGHEDKVVAARTHDFGARLWVRLFGLPYSHPQPEDGRTYQLRNADGAPLPTTFAGEPAAEGLIGPDETRRRYARMKRVCQACHGGNWISGHFAKMHATLRETDAMTLAATELVQRAWDAGLADRANPFDEPVEHLWVAQWLFHANSVRYASAMGGPDYATFKLGWWEMTRTVARMETWLARRQERRRRGPGSAP